MCAVMLPCKSVTLSLPSSQVYRGLSGQLLATLGDRCGLVYGLAWAKGGSCLVSAMADFTTKVWHLAAAAGQRLAAVQQLLLQRPSLGQVVQQAAACAGWPG